MHPNYILENDNVSLMGQTATHTYFCVTDPNVDVFDTTKAPFLWEGQSRLAQHLIIMPHKHFIALGKESEVSKSR